MTEKSEPAHVPDPFDPESLRVHASDGIETERMLSAVPVRKPRRSDWVRVNPDPTFCIDVRILERENGMEKESYLVPPEMAHMVAEETRVTRLFSAMTKRGLLFLWPVKLPIEGNDTGRRIYETALQATEHAKTKWVRVAWNRELGGYELFLAKGDLGEPQWSEKSFRDLLALAFATNIIDRPDHPVIRELNGEL